MIYDTVIYLITIEKRKVKIYNNLLFYFKTIENNQPL